nr:relaxase/mobilization nuclease domain-containing protein [Mucilaginibacter sp. L294]
MVAVINSAKSIRGPFLYNENKVKEGAADCLMAANYPMDMEDMTENMRLNMLSKIVERAKDTQRPSIHISLNFAPEEQPSKDLLKRLAQEYMDGIGFGGQPYLVYQHFDSGHPHIHIVTTKIRPDGTLIATNNIGRGISKQVRKELEIKYGLVKAESHNKEFFRPKAVDPAIVQYGKVSTKRAISSILSAVLNSYKYTSLEELNALLTRYNVLAERGDKDTRMYKNKGLAYRIIGADGKPVSTPILASAFHQKALLKDIEGRFLRNDVERQQHKAKARTAIDKCIRTSGGGIENLKELLHKTGIDLIPRQNAQGRIYGITFIDHRTKSVYNGNDLGTQYAAKALVERISQTATAALIPVPETSQKVVTKEKQQPVSSSSPAKGNQVGSFKEPIDHEKSIIEQLMQAEYSSNYLPLELRKSRKRRKKKKTNHL